MNRVTRILALALVLLASAAASRAWACQICDVTGQCINAYNNDNGWSQCRILLDGSCATWGTPCTGGGPCPGCGKDDCGGTCAGRPTTDVLVRVVLLELPAEGAAQLFPAGTTQRNLPGPGNDASISALVGAIARLAKVSPDAVTLAYGEIDRGRGWFSAEGHFADGSGLAFRAAPTGLGVEAVAYQRGPGAGTVRTLSGSATDDELLVTRATLEGRPYALVFSSMRGARGDEPNNLGTLQDVFVSSARYYANRDRLGWSLSGLNEAQFNAITSPAPRALPTSWGSLKVTYR